MIEHIIIIHAVQWNISFLSLFSYDLKLKSLLYNTEFGVPYQFLTKSYDKTIIAGGFYQ